MTMMTTTTTQIHITHSPFSCLSLVYTISFKGTNCRLFFFAHEIAQFFKIWTCSLGKSKECWNCAYIFGIFEIEYSRMIKKVGNKIGKKGIMLKVIFLKKNSNRVSLNILKLCTVHFLKMTITFYRDMPLVWVSLSFAHFEMFVVGSVL